MHKYVFVSIFFFSKSCLLTNNIFLETVNVKCSDIFFSSLCRARSALCRNPSFNTEVSIVTGGAEAQVTRGGQRHGWTRAGRWMLGVKKRVRSIKMNIKAAGTQQHPDTDGQLPYNKGGNPGTKLSSGTGEHSEEQVNVGWYEGSC